MGHLYGQYILPRSSDGILDKRERKKQFPIFAQQATAYSCWANSEQ